MRYTKKSTKFVNAYEWNEELPTKTFVQLGMNKLGQLEDIEDELGIDLVTLFKALKQDCIYRKECFPDRIIKCSPRCIEEDGIRVLDQYDYLFEGSIVMKYKDYGKTWALTKEELL